MELLESLLVRTSLASGPRWSCSSSQERRNTEAQTKQGVGTPHRQSDSTQHPFNRDNQWRSSGPWHGILPYPWPWLQGHWAAAAVMKYRQVLGYASGLLKCPLITKPDMPRYCGQFFHTEFPGVISDLGHSIISLLPTLVQEVELPPSAKSAKWILYISLGRDVSYIAQTK